MLASLRKLDEKLGLISPLPKQVLFNEHFLEKHHYITYSYDQIPIIVKGVRSFNSV